MMETTDKEGLEGISSTMIGADSWRKCINHGSYCAGHSSAGCEVVL